MKIICTIREFGEMVRQCEYGSCPCCALNHVCDNGGIEQFVSAENVIPEDVPSGGARMERDPHDGC